MCVSLQLWLSLQRDVKEKICYLALDYDTELNSVAGCSDNKLTHLLSDGHLFFYCQHRTFPLLVCVWFVF